MPWFNCKVIAVGPTESGIIPIWLQDTADPSQFTKWFHAIPEVKREMLSVALTAMSTGLRVSAAIPTPDKEYSNVERLYLTLQDRA